MKISPDEKLFEVIDKLQQMQISPVVGSGAAWDNTPKPPPGPPKKKSKHFINQPFFDAIDGMQQMQTIIVASGGGRDAPKHPSQG